MKKSIFILIAIAFALFSGETKAQPQAGQNQLRRMIDQKFLAQYADNLEARLKGKSVGYSFTVAGGSGNFMVSRAGGDARRDPDANPRKMTADDKFNIASVSKTITAAAVLKLLDEKKISVDTPVHSYLPASWTLGKNFKTVTFRELLTHRSGIRCGKEVTYENLKDCVASGIETENKQKDCGGGTKEKHCYNNSNYALFRFIIPRLNGYPTTPVKIDEKNLPSIYAKLYADYVRQNVFMPVGLRGIDLKPVATDPALAYQFPSPVQAGDSFGDMTETSASRGWNMSSKQIAVFLHNLLYTEKILPKAVSEQMKNEQLGLWKKDVMSGLADYEHGGYYPGKDKQGNVFNKGEMNTLALAFSNGVSVAIIVNSQFVSGISIADAARGAMKETLK